MTVNIFKENVAHFHKNFKFLNGGDVNIILKVDNFILVVTLIKFISYIIQSTMYPQIIYINYTKKKEKKNFFVLHIMSNSRRKIKVRAKIVDNTYGIHNLDEIKSYIFHYLYNMYCI